MTLKNNGFIIEIPDILIQERMKLLKCKSMEDNIQEIKNDILNYLSCIEEEKYFDKELQSLIIDYIESEVDLFR